MASADRLLDRLVEVGKRLVAEPRRLNRYSGVQAADELINDLDRFPHAYVIACVMDRQMQAEKAWLVPYELKQRLGAFDIGFLGGLPLAAYERAMAWPTHLHRFHQSMACFVHDAVQRICRQYGGDASAIWAGRPSSADVVARFREFRGVGPKIAAMAANLLVRDMKVSLSDHQSIDISADPQVQRVFTRMGFVPQGASLTDMIHCARRLHCDYPGIFDGVLWELCRTVCLPQEPRCTDCQWSTLCGYGRTASQ
ncbi:MAG: iron-sulfur cluster loop [Bacillota bacterium]|nr:iron-sulfur cluster loop [Bacillota bacterium]